MLVELVFGAEVKRLLDMPVPHSSSFGLAHSLGCCWHLETKAVRVPFLALLACCLSAFQTNICKYMFFSFVNIWVSVGYTGLSCDLGCPHPMLDWCFKS